MFNACYCLLFIIHCEIRGLLFLVGNKMGHISKSFAALCGDKMLNTVSAFSVFVFLFCFVSVNPRIRTLNMLTWSLLWVHMSASDSLFDIFFSFKDTSLGNGSATDSFWLSMSPHTLFPLFIFFCVFHSSVLFAFLYLMSKAYQSELFSALLLQSLSWEDILN